MDKKPTITAMQWSLLYIGCALAFPYTFMPILDAPPGNQDVWIVLLLGMAFSVLFQLPFLFLMNKFRGCNTHEIGELILGKFLGRLPNLLYLGICLFCFTACIMAIVMFMKFYLFTYTPIWFMLLYIIVPVTYASYKGAGTLGRLSTFLVPFIMLTILFYFVLGSPHFDLREFKPVLADSSMGQIIKGAVITAARISEVVILYIFSYFLEDKAKINKTYAITTIIYTVCFFLILIPIVLTLGMQLAKNSWSPYFLYTRQVQSYDFIERVQSLNTLAWVPVILLKVSVYNYLASYLFAGIVKAKSHRPFVIPFSIIAVIVSLLPIMNKSSTIDFIRSDQFFPFVIFPVTVLVPFAMVIIYFIRRKKINQKLKQKLASHRSAN